MSNDIGVAEASVLLESLDWTESKNITNAVFISLQSLSAVKNSVGRRAASGRLRTVGTAQCTRLLPAEQLGVLLVVLRRSVRSAQSDANTCPTVRPFAVLDVQRPYLADHLAYRLLRDA